MRQEEKAIIYGNLLNEHTKCFNEINRIKGESLELNADQLKKIKKLELRQQEIMREVNRLMS